MKKCRDVMTGDPVCCVPNDTAARVAKLMKTENIGSVPICEDRHGKKLVGIITDRDLALQVVAESRDASSTTLQSLMTRQPFTCRAEDNLQKALDEMEKHQVRRIPVVDNNGQLIGIISQADVANRGEEPEKTAHVVGEISRPSMQGRVGRERKMGEVNLVYESPGERDRQESQMAQNPDSEGGAYD